MILSEKPGIFIINKNTIQIANKNQDQMKDQNQISKLFQNQYGQKDLFDNLVQDGNTLPKKLSMSDQIMIYDIQDHYLQQQQSDKIKCQVEVRTLDHQDSNSSLNYQNVQAEREIARQNQNASPLKQNDHPQFQKIYSKQVTKFPKNNNVIKLFNREIIHGSLKQQYMRFFEDEPIILKQVKKFIFQQKKEYKKNKKNWNNNIDSMIKIFGLVEGSSNPEKRSLIMRKIAHQMIYQQIIPGVLKNPQIKKETMKKCYIHTLITLSYRCVSHQLMNRTQI